MESHILALKHVRLVALVHPNLRFLLSKSGEENSFSGKPGRKGLGWELATKLPDGAIRKLLHKAETAGNLFLFSGNSFAQVRELKKLKVKYNNIEAWRRTV